MNEWIQTLVLPQGTFYLSGQEADIYEMTSVACSVAYGYRSCCYCWMLQKEKKSVLLKLLQIHLRALWQISTNIVSYQRNQYKKTLQCINNPSKRRVKQKLASIYICISWIGELVHLSEQTSNAFKQTWICRGKWKIMKQVQGLRKVTFFQEMDDILHSPRGAAAVKAMASIPLWYCIKGLE